MSEIDIRSGLSEEERKRLEKIDRLDSNKKRKKLIIAGVTTVLILFFVLGTVFGGIHILSYEGTQALPVIEPDYTAIPGTEEEIISSFNTLIEETKNFAGVKLDVSFGVDVPDESIVLSGDKADASKILVDHIKSSAVSVLSECYTDNNHKGTYGEDFSGLLINNNFTADDAEITAVVNEDDSNRAQYIFSFDGCSFDEISDKKVFELFGLDICDETVKSLKEHFKDMVNVNNAEIFYESFVMTANVSRLENRLDSVEQKRICNVTLPLEFIGDFADFGTLTLSFKVELTETLRFTRVELSFREDVFYIEKGSSDEFKTKVISDQSPAEVVIELISSDTSVLSVDGSFYKGVKVSSEPVTVTAKYTYNGVTYEDTCLFYVRVPVEGVKVKEKEISLKKGENSTAEVTLSPEDATLTKVYWFTTDENIASVDENGVITAVNDGTADVYCITLDGNYKSSCKVTVEG